MARNTKINITGRISKSRQIRTRCMHRLQRRSNGSLLLRSPRKKLHLKNGQTSIWIARSMVTTLSTAACDRHSLIHYILVYAYYSVHNQFMSELRYQFNLTSYFSSRLKEYLLLLEVTNHVELVCTVTSFLSTKDILNLASTSSQFRTLQKIQSIEIRLLKAKLEIYEKPKIQISYGFFLNMMPLKPTEAMPGSSEQIGKKFEKLKKINEQIRRHKTYNREKGRASTQPAIENTGNKQFVKIQQENVRQDNAESIKMVKRNGWSTVKEEEFANLEAFQQCFAEQIKSRPREINLAQEKRTIQDNSFAIKIMQYQQYELAKQDYERRKLRRNANHFISMEELKKLGDSDPCSREIYNSLNAEEKEKRQRQNIAQLRMKPVKHILEEAKSEKFLSSNQLQRVVVVKQSIAGKMLSNIKSLIWKQ